MNQTMVDKYQEQAYSDWLSDEKNKSKIKKTGVNGTINAYDEKENRAMYDAYIAELRANDAYESAKNTLDTNKALALEANADARAGTMRENAILTEKAKEYAERRAIMNGTASAGVSQTSMIDLMSQMAGARANAQASYDNQRRTIIQDYQDAVYEAERARDNTIMSAQNTANAVAADTGIQRAERAEKIRESHATDVQEALANYEAGNISFDKLEEIYKDNEKFLDAEADYRIISEYESTKKSHGSDWFNASTENGKVSAEELKVMASSPVLRTEEITVENINSRIDVSGAGSGDNQDKWVNSVIARIKKGQIEDGTIIDMNYGSINGQNKGNYFVYHNGNLYQSEWTYDELNALLKESNKTDFSQRANKNGEMKFFLNGKVFTFLRGDN